MRSAALRAHRTRRTEGLRAARFAFLPLNQAPCSNAQQAGGQQSDACKQQARRTWSEERQEKHVARC